MPSTGPESRWQQLGGGIGRGYRGARGPRDSETSGLTTRLQISTGSRLCNREPSESRGRLGKQGEPINKATWPRDPGGPG